MLMLCGGAAMALLIAVFMLGVRGWTLAAAALAIGGVVAIASRISGPRFDHWLQGALGEESVGALLDTLTDEGWLVIHDASLGRGNVDHIVVGQGGVFTIETKSHRGRIPVTRLDPYWLKQAYAGRKLIERITGMKVEALLVFSEAWLVGKMPARREGVTVLPARMLAWYLSRRKPVMSAQHAAEVGEALRLALEVDGA
jgi:hypothetical protein